MVLIFIFFKLLALDVFAGNASVGLQLDDDYYGPAHPEVLPDFYRGKMEFVDDRERKAYLFKTLQPEILELKEFFEGRFINGMNCPDTIYNKYYNSIEFSIRLASLSYLFEGLRDYEYQSRKLGLKNSCFYNYGQILKACAPKSFEMKSFVKNSQVVLSQLEDIVIPLEESRKESIESWFSTIRVDKNESLMGKRLSLNCERTNCLSSKSKEQIIDEINLVCSTDKDLFVKICSENDHLGGLSYIPELYPLILSSDIYSQFDKDEYKYGCLKRYISTQRRNEYRSKEILLIFKYFYSRFWKSENSSYQRGRLFSVGSLYNYEKKGLKNIFQEEVKKVKTVSMKIDEQIEKPSFEVIELPKVVTKKKVKKEKIQKIKKVAPKKVVTKKYSAFKEARDLRDKLKLDQVIVDMNKFIKEEAFTDIEFKKLSVASAKFTSQKSLKEMKEFDKLGSRKAPVPLNFLKYLIMNDMHQGLYNIQFVLGHSFHVINNIDKKLKENEVDLIKIQNNDETEFKWQIYVLKG